MRDGSTVEQRRPRREFLRDTAAIASAGGALRTTQGLPADFYHQTLSRPDDTVQEGFEESLATIEKLEKPGIAYKVLGAGRITRRSLMLGTLLLCWSGPALAQVRTWTDSTGQYQREGELVDFNDGKVVLRLSDGGTIATPMEQFSKADQEYVPGELQRRRETLKAALSNRPGTVLYRPGRELCKLANTMIDESSGLACSRRQPGVFWTHNDSGDDARLYAFDAKGRDLGWCVLEDTRAYDFEDVASFTLEKKHYLLVGDTGNNVLAATVQILYLIEEPPVDPQAGPVVRRAPLVQIMHFAYEDDHRNCEGLAVDPTSKTILLVSKESGWQCYVYALAWPQNDPKKATIAKKIATLKLPPATAMDVSPDGRRAVVLTYGNAYQYTRGPKEDWAAAFARPPCEIVLPRRIQGESICYGPDGKTLYLTSEKLPTPLLEIPVERDK